MASHTEQDRPHDTCHLCMQVGYSQPSSGIKTSNGQAFWPRRSCWVTPTWFNPAFLAIPQYNDIAVVWWVWYEQLVSCWAWVPLEKNRGPVVSLSEIQLDKTLESTILWEIMGLRKSIQTDRYLLVQIFWKYRWRKKKWITAGTHCLFFTIL